MSLPLRLHAAKVTAKREVKSTLYGVGLYVTLCLVFFSASFFFVRGTLRSMIDQGVLAAPNPLMGSLFIAVGLAAIYLGLCSSLTISRDRDLGTLEALFYGPVDAASYILGKYLHQLVTHLVVIVFAVIYFYLLAATTQIGFSVDIVTILVLSLFLTSSMVSFGIFLSVSTRKMIVSVILFLALVLFFLGFAAVHAWVVSLPSQNLAGALVYVRIVLDRMNDVVKWISPVAYFQRGMMAVSTQSAGQYVISIVQSLVYSLVLLALSVWAFQRKGVRR